MCLFHARFIFCTYAMSVRYPCRKFLDVTNNLLKFVRFIFIESNIYVFKSFLSTGWIGVNKITWNKIVLFYFSVETIRSLKNFLPEIYLRGH